MHDIHRYISYILYLEGVDHQIIHYHNVIPFHDHKFYILVPTSSHLYNKSSSFYKWDAIVRCILLLLWLKISFESMTFDRIVKSDVYEEYTAVFKLENKYP